MATIEVFADVCCPFTYAGLVQLIEARERERLDARVVLRAWPLEWVNGHPFDPEHIAAEVRALRRDVTPDHFVGFDASRFPVTSLPAFGVAHAAYDISVELGERVSMALRAAVFEAGSPLDDAALDAIAAEHGVTRPSAVATEARVRADWEEGQRRAVIGSPHVFLPDGSGVFCPILDISRDSDGEFHVALKPGALDLVIEQARQH